MQISPLPVAMGLALLLVLSLGGCGQKGELYLPDDEPKELNRGAN